MQSPDARAGRVAARTRLPRRAPSNRSTLGVDPAKCNVNGGSIAIGHPFGMTGSRMVGHVLLEGQRRKAKHVVARPRRPVFVRLVPGDATTRTDFKF